MSSVLHSLWLHETIDEREYHYRNHAEIMQAISLCPSAHRSIINFLYPNFQPSDTSDATDLLDVILACVLVRGFEEAGGIFSKPLGQFVKFFAEAVDGLLVHVCLGDEFGEGH